MPARASFTPDAVTPRFEFSGYSRSMPVLVRACQMWHFLLVVNNLADSRGIVGGQMCTRLETLPTCGKSSAAAYPAGLSASRQF